MFEALLTILYTLLLAYSLKYIPFFANIPGIPAKLLLLLFLAKVFTGQAYLLIYTYHYDTATADIHRFFNDGKVLYSAIRSNPVDYLRMLTGIGAGSPHLDHWYQGMTDWYRPWISPVYNDNRILIRFNALLHLISFGVLKVHVVIANFISLAGFVALYKFALSNMQPKKANWLLPGIFLLPSVLFWSAGIIKETLLIPALGFFLFFAEALPGKAEKRPANLLGLLATLGLLLLLKSYILFLLLPCYLAFRLSREKPLWKPWMVFPAVILFYSGLVLLAGKVFPRYDLISMIANKQKDFILFSLSVNAGSVIREGLLEPGLSGILTYLPRGLFNTLFYPHILQPFNPLSLMAAFENLLILAIIALIVINGIRKPLPALAWMGIWFTLITFTFIGTIAPVAGSLVRYKTPALPFLWMALVACLPAGIYITNKNVKEENQDHDDKID